MKKRSRFEVTPKGKAKTLYEIFNILFNIPFWKIVTLKIMLKALYSFIINFVYNVFNS